MAKHKKTGKEVAIKTVKRRAMKPFEVLQMRREIDILKMCHHDNVIKLQDVFETANNHYIVLDYMAGRDLYYYLEKRRFKIPEQRAKVIAR